MGFYEWVASMRKKPIAVRRQFAGLVAIVVMGIVTFVWFIFFFTNLEGRLNPDLQPEVKTEEEGVPAEVTPPAATTTEATTTPPL